MLNDYDTNISNQAFYSATHRQLAHDIRSPLTVLNTLIKHLSEVPDDYKSIMHTALQRLNDIAAQVLESKESHITIVDNTTVKIASHNLTNIIQSIVKEKQIEHSNKEEIDILFNTNEPIVFEHPNFNPTEFKRVISNLINNAIEAIEEKGNVTVRLKRAAGSQGRRITVSIIDTGKGIPQHIMPQLMQKGASFGKPNGNGLGLYHANKFIESCNGKLTIHSMTTRGTTIRINL